MNNLRNGINKIHKFCINHEIEIDYDNAVWRTTILVFIGILILSIIGASIR